MPQFQKHFSLAEANAFLPRVRRVLGVVQRFLSGEALPGIPGSAPDAPSGFGFESTEGAGGGASGVGGDSDAGGSASAAAHDPKWHSPETFRQKSGTPGIGEGARRRAALDLLKEEILDQGVVIQDLWRGLIDFPALSRDGDEVLLCYELSDGDHIVAFHDLESGFSGRRAIEEFEEG